MLSKAWVSLANSFCSLRRWHQRPHYEDMLLGIECSLEIWSWHWLGQDFCNSHSESHDPLLHRHPVALSLTVPCKWSLSSHESLLCVIKNAWLTYLSLHATSAHDSPPKVWLNVSALVGFLSDDRVESFPCSSWEHQLLKQDSRVLTFWQTVFY